MNQVRLTTGKPGMGLGVEPGFIVGQMGLSMKDNGLMIWNMDLALKNTLMVIVTVENGKMGCVAGKELINGMMVLFMKVDGKIT
nr:hypothetical protein [Paenibacillus sp. J45TS6]